MVLKKIIYLLLPAILLSCNENQQEKYELLILNANVIDVASGKTTENQLIAISNDTIQAVDEMSNKKNYKSQKVIDAKNAFVMPGLWDNHVHFRGGDSLIQENKNLLPLYLAYGITTVRDCGGDISKSVLNWRSQIAKGELAGPTIFSSGPKLDGIKPAWPGSLPVVTQQDVNKALDSLQSLKVDFVKIYDGSLTPETYYMIIKSAKERGMLTTGHMPMNADLMKGIDDGLNGSEHMFYTIKACSPEADSLSQLHLGYGMMGELIKSYDPNLAADVFQKMEEKHFSVTPTLHIQAVLANILEKDHSTDSLLQFIEPGIQKTYRGRIEGAKHSKKNGNNLYESVQKLADSMMVPMYNAGVNLLAGSDAGAFNSFVYPGESLIDELHSLVHAGLTPQQALKTSMINGAKFFGLEKYYGSIEKGKIADLIILQKNPLENIDNISSLKMVIKDTAVYNQQRLQHLLKRFKVRG